MLKHATRDTDSIDCPKQKRARGEGLDSLLSELPCPGRKSVEHIQHSPGILGPFAIYRKVWALLPF